MLFTYYVFLVRLLICPKTIRFFLCLPSALSKSLDIGGGKEKCMHKKIIKKNLKKNCL